MTALAMDVREMSGLEIDMISGADFWERVGEAIDNPWTTAGRAMDWIGANAGGSLEGAWATAKIG